MPNQAQEPFSLEFSPVSQRQQIQQLAQIASEVWHQHYAAILSAEQIDYMVEQFQSTSAIEHQLNQEHYSYYLVHTPQGPAGYVGVQLEPQGDSLFLSKLYLKREFRGKGIARQALSFLEGLARSQGRKTIWLTVNKHNAGSIAVYRHLGFETVRAQVSEIGQGYVMDDYVMEKPVSAG